MTLDRTQKLGIVALIAIIGSILLVIYNIKIGNFEHWVGIPELAVIFGFASVGFLVSIIMIIPRTVNVNVKKDYINMYRKHLRKTEMEFNYKDIVRAYFDYLADDIGIVVEKNEKSFFVHVSWDVVDKNPELKNKLKEKGIPIERASKRTYKDHDVEFNKKVNKIRNSCDEVIDIYI